MKNDFSKTIAKFKAVKVNIEEACRSGLYRATHAARMDAGKTTSPKVNNFPKTTKDGRKITEKKFLSQRIPRTFQYKNRPLSEMKVTIANNNSKDKPLRTSHFLMQKRGKYVSTSILGIRSISGGFLIKRTNEENNSDSQKDSKKTGKTVWRKSETTKGDDVALVRRTGKGRLPIKNLPGTSIRNLVDANSMKEICKQKLLKTAQSAMIHYINKTMWK